MSDENITHEPDAAQTEATNLPNWHVEPEPAEPTAEAEPEPAEPNESEGDNRQVAKLRKEAARYRTELRQTQAQLEAATTQLTAARRQIVANSREVTGYVRGDAINDMLSELDVASLFDETGQLDSNALADAVRQQIRRRPYWDRQPGKQAMQTALSNSAPHVHKPVSADPLSRALRLRNS